jgi:hypothetical protein
MKMKYDRALSIAWVISGLPGHSQIAGECVNRLAAAPDRLVAFRQEQ